MKAVCATVGSVGQPWDRFKSKILRRDRHNCGLSLQLTEMPEPPIPAPGWVRMRTIMSGVSGLDEGMFLHGDATALGPFLSFPFVPGNENLGIVTDVGPAVQGIEPGERVLVDPLLSCRSRGIRPLCSSCMNGNPSACRNFARGVPGAGMIIGGCRDTGGGWGDFFVAHADQLRIVPHHMDSDQAVLIPEFCRAVRAILQHPPVPGDRLVIMGARSLGLLTLLALTMLGHQVTVLVIAEHAMETDLVRKLAPCKVTLFTEPAGTAELVADFVKAKVRYPEIGFPLLEGGADLVYETTGVRENVDFALRLAGEGKKIVLMGLNQVSGFDLSPLWLKEVEIRGTAFSGLDSYNGEVRETMDIALDLVSSHGLPTTDLISHRFSLEDHTSALAVLEDRAATKAVKVLIRNVM
jgi:threonine dehydrogenase-like Zn-dependent dehydrogenase